jgi:hypothetical protein
MGPDSDGGIRLEGLVTFRRKLNKSLTFVTLETDDGISQEVTLIKEEHVKAVLRNMEVAMLVTLDVSARTTHPPIPASNDSAHADGNSETVPNPNSKKQKLNSLQKFVCCEVLRSQPSSQGPLHNKKTQPIVKPCKWFLQGKECPMRAACNRRHEFLTKKEEAQAVRSQEARQARLLSHSTLWRAVTLFRHYCS